MISELVKPRPETNVIRSVEEIDEQLLYLSVLTLGEIRRGVAALPHSARRTELEAWLESDLRLRFSRRILSVDEPVVDAGALWWERLRNTGRALPVIDGLLAATAIHHNLTLATRNTGETEGTDVPLFNPWQA